MTEIARLLTDARKLHAQKKEHAGRKVKDGIRLPNYPSAEQCIFDALTLRQQAHDLDPDHTDPAWRIDLTENRGIPHERLMAFFREYLTTDPQSELAREFAETGGKMPSLHQQNIAPVSEVVGDRNVH